MAEIDDILAKYTAASEMVAAKIGPKGPDLKRQVARAGRRLPRKVRHDLLVIAHAADFVEHPKLAKQVNEETIAEAFGRAKAHLDPIDPRDRQRGLILQWLADNAFNMLILLVFVVVVLRLRGIV